MKIIKHILLIAALICVLIAAAHAKADQYPQTPKEPPKTEQPKEQGKEFLMHTNIVKCWGVHSKSAVCTALKTLPQVIDAIPHPNKKDFPNALIVTLKPKTTISADDFKKAMVTDKFLHDVVLKTFVPYSKANKSQN